MSKDCRRTGPAMAGRARTQGADVIPIHELLARIKWDQAYGRAQFVIGYWDRVSGAEVSVPLERIHIESGARFAFEAGEADGTLHTVPVHRGSSGGGEGERGGGRARPGGPEGP